MGMNGRLTHLKSNECLSISHCLKDRRYFETGCLISLGYFVARLWHYLYANEVNMLSYELNSKILKLAQRHTVKDIAPDSFASLKGASTSGLVVYSGGSDNTIYGDPRVNWAFRAWHDKLHLDLNAPFTLQGETLVGLEAG